MGLSLCEVPVDMVNCRNRQISACKALLLVMILLASATAQRLKSDTPVSAYSPTFDVGGGYSFLSSSMPTAGQVQFNGLQANARANFLPHWGIALDFGYVRTSDILNTGHPGYITTFLGGPVFYPIAHGRTRPFLHALIGAGLVDGAVPLSNDTYLHGWVERPAYAFSGGIVLYGTFRLGRCGGVSPDGLRRLY